MLKINKTTSLTVILGAGFSKDAGLPLANEINKYFDRDNKSNLLSFSSGEHRWYEFADDVDKNNGRLSDDYLICGYVLNELVLDYKKEKQIFDSYENFYQYILDIIKQKNRIASIFINAQNKAESKEEYFYNKNSSFKNKDRNEVRALLNELVSDLLFVRKERKDFIDSYIPFIRKINSFNKLDFITLNHDLFLETLITKELNVKFSDGFSREQQTIFANNNPLNIFNNSFIEPISIIKLHGSINIYRYDIYIENGIIANPTGDYLYYKTNSYNEKQTPERHNPLTGEVIQTFHKEISPQFITGNRKEEIIMDNNMYQDLYTQFENRINHNQELLIIGYSYSDYHVNIKIESAINKGHIKKIINVNPMINFPFEEKCKNIEIINYSNISNIM